MEKKILIVDDEVQILRSLNRLLTLEGYQVTTVDSCEAALELLEQQDFPVILSDLRMPKMLGSEFFCVVKQRYPNSIRIIMSGYSDFKDITKAINEGAVYKFIAKPWQQDELVSQLQQAFQVYQKRMQRTQADQFLDNALEAVAVVNSEGFLESVNKTYLELTGFHEQTILGMPLVMMSFDDEPQPISMMSVSQQIADGAHSFEDKAYIEDVAGNKVPVQYRVLKVDDVSSSSQQYVFSFIDISDSVKHHQQLVYQSTHDELTGLINRKGLVANIDSLIAQNNGSSAMFAVINIGLYRFNKINNVMGYEVGDEVLKKVANDLSDFAPNKALLARSGNVDFSLVTQQFKARNEIDQLISDLKERLKHPTIIGDNEIHLMYSIGVSIYPNDGGHALELLKNSNIALSFSKKSGIDYFKYYQSDMKSESEKALKLESEIRQAFQRDEFVLYFQPKLSLTENKIVGAEALIRWMHSKKGLVMPGAFIPFCEETGLIIDIDRQTLLRCCQKIKQWRSLHNLDITLSLNVSAKEFNRDDFVAHVRKGIVENDIAPDKLELEITESLLLESKDECEKILQALKFEGVKLSMDDFGTGYSSLNYLTCLPFDIVKIDRSFIFNMNRSRKVSTVLKAMLNLGSELGLTTVAEGAEEQAHIDYLTQNKCHLVQGYLISRPLPEDQFIEFVKRYNSK